jgi:hypothetical protein
VIKNGDMDEETRDMNKPTLPLIEKKDHAIVMEGVVKRVTNVFSMRQPCLNLLLQALPYPRLWITSTLDSDGKEGIYKKDILLYASLKVTLKSPQQFEIYCPYSKKKYVFNTHNA